MFEGYPLTLIIFWQSSGPLFFYKKKCVKGFKRISLFYNTLVPYLFSCEDIPNMKKRWLPWHSRSGEWREQRTPWTLYIGATQERMSFSGKVWYSLSNNNKQYSVIFCKHKLNYNLELIWFVLFMRREISSYGKAHVCIM